MANLVDRFGQAIDKLAAEDPRRSRALMLAGLRAFGLKLSLLPEKRLPKSRQGIAVLLNRLVVEMLTHPDKAALTSVFLPCELLHAAGISPMCAELFAAFVNGCHAESGFIRAAEERGIAETFCSYHKVLLGSAYTGVLPKPRFIVNTSLVCDANNLTFRALAEHYGIEQFYVDVPPFDTPESLYYVAEQLRQLKGFLEDHSGRRIEDEALAEAMGRSARTVRSLKAAIPLKAAHWLPGDIASELYEIYATHIGLGTDAAERYAAQLLSDLAQAPRSGGLRILWIHTIPNWQQPVRELFNLSDRAVILSCDMNFDSLFEADPAKPFESMARRLVSSSFNGSGARRIGAAVEMARALNADGAVVFCHWGCKQTMGVSQQMKQALEEAGFPALILNGDGCDAANASDGQVKTRLDAFAEMLDAGRAGGPAR